MITYEELLMESDRNHLVTKEKPLPISKGRIKGNRIAIRQDLTEKEKKCVLAEELGHHYTAAGEILDQSSVSNRKQELRGRAFAYNKLVGLTGIVGAYKHGCASLTESAEYLDVTEEFLTEALNYYKTKYGKGARIDNHIIYFEPCLGVFEMI